MENKHEDTDILINELKESMESMKDILDNSYQGIVLVYKVPR